MLSDITSTPLFPKAQGFFAFFEFATQDFARLDSGECVDELNVVQLFVTRQSAINKCYQLFSGDAVAWTKNDKALGQFTCLVIRNDNHSRIHNSGMLHQQ